MPGRPKGIGGPGHGRAAHSHRLVNGRPYPFTHSDAYRHPITYLFGDAGAFPDAFAPTHHHTYPHGHTRHGGLWAA